MTKYLHLLIFLLTFASPLKAREATEAEKVRKAIDNICGDTWCEGDYSFRFKKVVFDEANNLTRVYFNMGLREFAPHVETANEFESSLDHASFDVSCVVKGFSHPKDILADDHTVKWEFYTPMSDCVQRLEQKLRSLSNLLYDGPAS